ncbi:MAG: pilus assembly protein TadB [Jatrophihabitantaceae bacterium]
MALPVGLLAGPVPAILAGIAGGTTAWCWRQWVAERAGEQDRAALAAALAALAEEYAAGATSSAAFEHSAPVAGRYASAMAAAAGLAGLGEQPGPALQADVALTPLALACQLAGSSGASFTDLVQGVRADLAADRATHAAVLAAVAGPRSSALLLAALPVVGLAMGAGMGADPARVLVHTPAGLLVLSIGVLLELAGLVWTVLLTSRACR